MGTMGNLADTIDFRDLQLSDLIDVAALQSLMDDFYKITAFPMSIADMQGKVLVGVGWQEICTRFHRVHPKTCRNCVESDTQLTLGIPAGEVRQYRCKNHMVDLATPIIVAGHHLGNVFSGQFFFDDEPPDRELFRRQAKRCGFDEDDYLDALEAVPHLSRAAVEAGMRFFIKLAGMISSLGYTNLNLARSLAEREALSTSLRERETLLHSVCEGTEDAIFVKDCQGRYIMANTATLRVFGKAPEEVLGRNDSEICEDQEISLPLAAADRRVMESGIPETMEELIRSPEGLRVFLSTKAPRLNGDGKVIGVIGIARDITERKRAEEEIRSAKTVAEEANRAKSEFLANMSHEIRTPMTVFMAAIEYLLQIDETPDHRELLTMADKAVQHLRAVIDDILDFSRIEARRMDLMEESFDLRTCVSDIVGMLDIQAREKNLRLSKVISPEVPDLVVGDSDRLGQVLINLVGNAVKFTPAGEVRVSVQIRDTLLEFAISDTGIGIPEGKMDLLFKSFSQMDSSLTRKFGGSGLGLAVSKGLVELMGGEIGVESIEGKGSVFTFSIPLKTPDLPVDQVATVHGRRAMLHNPTPNNLPTDAPVR